jgi:hypothetical protein
LKNTRALAHFQHIVIDARAAVAQAYGIKVLSRARELQSSTGEPPVLPPWSFFLHAEFLL